ncbi:hypothetical protein [Rhizobium sp. NPDC090279]|uniref:hypothetical protein n=1 Tax=Rhizobium sp. NPDC090279 TaxID=3364499 RepID=UPI00383BCC77
MKQLHGKKRTSSAVIALTTSLCLMAAECRAETAYIAQIPVNVTTTATFGDIGSQPQPQWHHSPTNHSAAGTNNVPEANIAPHGNNLAQALQIGMRNSVYQLQAGTGNISTAGIIGNYGNVNVLQAGNNLRSNVVLLNGAGLNVSVLQPAGSAPVNVLIARLPGGGLLIKR